ncbi:MAG: EamA/RhaT family transporter [Bacteroidetes bacterium]|nr:EamA/RhaT family transporter [Bacteroidota bacterium]
MKLSPKLQGNLIMLFVMTIFGLNIPVTKELYLHHYMTPFALTTVRVTFAAVAFWLVSFFFPREKLTRKDVMILLVGGLSGTILNQGLFAFGLEQTSPVDASIITTSTPLFAMLIAAVILKEPITFKKAGGILLGALGAVWLVFQGKHLMAGGNSGNAIGNISIVASQFFYAFYLVITKPLSLKYSPLTIMKWMFSFATIALLPFTWKATVTSPVFVAGESTGYWMLAFILFGATFLTFMMIPLAQKRIRPTTISAYNNLQPLIASFVAIWMGMDTFTFEKLLAAVLIFGGVYLVTMSKSREDLLQEKEVVKPSEQKQ